MMAAAALKQPALALDDEEAKSLATALGKVARHYPMKASAEVLDWTNLLMVCMTVYGTRFVALRVERQQREPAAKTALELVPGWAG